MERVDLENLKLSIVFATRGDFYGGDNIAKTLKFVKSMSKKLYGLNEKNYEIIVVDYNCVSNSQIKIALKSFESDQLKIIEINSEQLTKFVTAQLPFIEYHAKNIGIKNAVGEQILVVNSDVRISKKLLKACLKRPFIGNSFLRADRTDISFFNTFKFKTSLNTRGGEQNSDPTQFSPLNKKFWSGSRMLISEEKSEQFVVSPSGGVSTHYIHGAHGNAAGDFVCAPRWAWHKIKGYQENKYLTFMGDSFLICGFFQIGLRQIILPGPEKLIHIEHARPINHRKNWTQEDWQRFVVDFNLIAENKMEYKLVDEIWGEYEPQ